MNSITAWFLLAGVLLVLMALTSSVLKRLPLSPAVLYLLVGFGVGPYGWHLLHLNPFRDAQLLETLAEVAVLVSLFTTGLKLGPPLSDKRWWIPVRLAFLGMTLTVGMVTAIGYYLLDLPLGAAVLLGAILAPTDPVLAAEVQVEHHADRDRVRFGLTGEAGLNDGTAFPFVLLGLGLLGQHDLGAGGWKWFTFDVVYKTLAGLGSGFLLGWLIARLVLYLRKKHQEAVGRDEFLTLGLIALSFGFAELIHSYGFLAVLASGLALRRIEQKATGNQEAEVQPDLGEEAEEVSESSKAQEKENEDSKQTEPKKLVGMVLSFNEQLEGIGEVTLVLLLGGMLSFQIIPLSALWFIPLLFFVVRPLAVLTSFIGSRTSRIQRRMIAWFGIRGIGSIYYLMYALLHGLPKEMAGTITGLTFAAIIASIFVHGISVTPLMKRYEKKQEKAES